MSKKIKFCIHLHLPGAVSEYRNLDQSCEPKADSGVERRKVGKRKRTALLGLMPNLVKDDSLTMGWQLL
jgi:hypothetical protein